MAKTAPKPTDINAVEWEEIAARIPAFSLESPGDIAQGFYVETQTFELDDDNNPGEKRLTRFYVLETPDGLFGVWGSGLLDYKWNELGEVSPGTAIKIVYQGKRDLEGGRTARQYALFAAANRPF